MDKDILYRFFEGIVSIEEGEQIRAWLEESPQHEKELIKERKLFDAMMLLSRQKKGILHIRWDSVRNEFLKMAGVILLTLGLGYLYQQYDMATESPAMQTIYVPAGQRMNITLPDGTNVWLNARTAIQYPLTFNRKIRQIKLDGQAYFDVAKNPEKPFIVQTKNFDVEVVGTKFDVEAYSDKDKFETALIQGSVKLVSVANPKKTLMLEPDHKAFLEDGELKIAPVDDYNTYRWKEGLLCFTNETFATIMKDFEKYFEVTIEVSNQKVSKYYYTGKFRQTDGIDYALRVLQRDIAFTYTRDDENRIIYVK